MHGIEAQRSDGITVEVVRCFANQWSVFLTRDGTIVARSVEAFRCSRGTGNLSYQTAMLVAEHLVYC
jgi:hypothetical protein